MLRKLADQVSEALKPQNVLQDANLIGGAPFRGLSTGAQERAKKPPLQLINRAVNAAPDNTLMIRRMRATRELWA